MKKIFDAVMNCLALVAVMLIAWVLISFLQINSQNLKPNPEYHPLNAFFQHLAVVV